MRKEDAKIYSKKEIKGKCLKCGSWKFGKEGSIRIQPGGPNFEIWKCDECGSTFNVSPEN